MALRCMVFRGLVKEAEEDVNKFLESHPGICVIHMSQSESSDGHISLTMLVEIPENLPEGGF